MESLELEWHNQNVKEINIIIKFILNLEFDLSSSEFLLLREKNHFVKSFFPVIQILIMMKVIKFS